MIPVDVLTKLGLQLRSEPYGNSIYNKLQSAIFKEDPSVYLFDGCPLGNPYPERLYRIEKMHIGKQVRLLIYHDFIAGSNTGVSKVIIEKVNAID